MLRREIPEYSNSPADDLKLSLGNLISLIGWPERIAVLMIFTLAAALRFGWPGTSNFAFDEALISLNALKMARAGQFAFLGTASSVGAFFFPGGIWIFAIPYFVSPDPLVATLFVSLLSSTLYKMKGIVSSTE